MRIPSPFKPLSVSSSAGSREASTSSPVALLHRRSPFVRALCVLSIGALSAIAFRTGCAQSHSRLFFAGYSVVFFLSWKRFGFSLIEFFVWCFLYMKLLVIYYLLFDSVDNFGRIYSSFMVLDRNLLLLCFCLSIYLPILLIAQFKIF
jgi:hypothetical protein